jgi:hypothetical protein
MYVHGLSDNEEFSGQTIALECTLITDTFVGTNVEGFEGIKCLILIELLLHHLYRSTS